MTSSTTMTNVAMTTMKATMRTLGGMILRRADMRMFENVRTKVTATPIP